jgi:hypothetical protein
MRSGGRYAVHADHLSVLFCLLNQLKRGKSQKHMFWRIEIKVAKRKAIIAMMVLLDS